MSSTSILDWSASSFAFDEYKVGLSHECIRALATRAAMPKDLARLVRGYVEGWPGYVVLTGLTRLPQAAWPQHFQLLSQTIGSVIQQDSSGVRVREVTDRGTRIGEGRSARYADSRHGGSLHTDGAESPFPLPSYTTLCCIRRALRGGALQIISADSAYRRLARHSPELSRALLRPFHFDRRGDVGADGSSTVEKPVFFEGRDGLHVTYLREYIEVGHRHDHVPDLTATQRAALDALDTELSNPELIIEGFLDPGDVLVLNNQRILHGRTEFEDGPDPSMKRLLLRMWLRADESTEPSGQPREIRGYARQAGH
jgi:hypothetical protein